MPNGEDICLNSSISNKKLIRIFGLNHKTQPWNLITKKPIDDSRMFRKSMHEEKTFINMSIEKFKINKKYINTSNCDGIKQDRETSKEKKEQEKHTNLHKKKSKSLNSVKHVFDHIFSKVNQREITKTSFNKGSMQIKAHKKLARFDINKTVELSRSRSFMNVIGQTGIKSRYQSYKQFSNQNFCDFYKAKNILRIPKGEPELNLFVLIMKPPVATPLYYYSQNNTINLTHKKKKQIMNTLHILNFMNRERQKRITKQTSMVVNEKLAYEDMENIEEGCIPLVSRGSKKQNKKIPYQSLWLKRIDALLNVFSLEEVNYVGYYSTKFAKQGDKNKYYIEKDDEKQHIRYFVHKVLKDIVNN